MANALQFIFHLLAASNFGFGIYYDIWVLEFPAEYKAGMVEFAGRWKYLTFWDMVLQFVYFTLCVVNDLFGSSTQIKKKQHFLQTIRDTLFGSLVFPVGMFVASTFWAIWAVDRELVFPKVLDEFFPVWLNHIMHTSIVPFDLLEHAIVPKIYPARWPAVRSLTYFMLSYLVWVLFIAHYVNHWVYPLLEVLDWNCRGLFITASTCFAIMLYFVGERIHHKIWTTAGKVEKPEIKKPQVEKRQVEKPKPEQPQVEKPQAKRKTKQIKGK